MSRKRSPAIPELTAVGLGERLLRHGRGSGPGSEGSAAVCGGFQASFAYQSDIIRTHDVDRQVYVFPVAPLSPALCFCANRRPRAWHDANGVHSNGWRQSDRPGECFCFSLRSGGLAISGLRAWLHPPTAVVQFRVSTRAFTISHFPLPQTVQSRIINKIFSFIMGHNGGGHLRRGLHAALIGFLLSIAAFN